MVIEKTNEQVLAFSNKDLKPVLMEGSGEIKTPYYVIKDGEQAIFVVASGKNGSEYNKTIGYFSNFPGMQSYQCLYGQGVMVMQRNDSQGAKEFKVVTLSPGRQVVVPAGLAMCLVNTGSSLLVVIRTSALGEQDEDPKPLFEKQGFAYYIVEKKGEIAFESNLKYSVRPQITTE